MPTPVVRTSNFAQATGTTRPITSPISYVAGQLLVAHGTTEDTGTTLGGPTGGAGLAWVQVAATTASSKTRHYLWIAYAASSQTNQTITTTISNAASHGGLIVEAWPLGYSAGTVLTPATGSSGSPSGVVVATKPNSAISWASGDWAAANGASRVRFSVNGSTGVETLYGFFTGQVTVYGGYYEDVGPVGLKTVGLTAPSGQNWTLMAIEIRMVEVASGLSGGGNVSTTKQVPPPGPPGAAATTDQETPPQGTGVGPPRTRGAFRVAGRSWLFFADGDGTGANPSLYYTSSTDGEAWKAKTLVRSLDSASIGTSHVDVTFDGTYVHYIAGSPVLGPDAFYRRGLPNSDGSITWSAPASNITGGAFYNMIECGINVDTDGRAWVSGEAGSSTVFVFRNAAGGGTWENADEFPVQLSSDFVFWWTGIAPLDSGRMMAFYITDDGSVTSSGYALYARVWEGDYWSDEVVLTDVEDDALYAQNPHAFGWVTNPATGEAFVAWHSDGAGEVRVRRFHPSSGWGASEPVGPGLGAAALTLAFDDATGEVHLIFLGADPRRVKRAVRTEGGPWGAPHTVADTSALGDIRHTSLQVSERVADGVLLVSYQVTGAGRDVIYVQAVEAATAPPVAVFDAGGNGVVTFSGAPVANPGGAFAVACVIRKGDLTYTNLVTVETSNGHAFSIVLDEGGHGVEILDAGMSPMATGGVPTADEWCKLVVRMVEEDGAYRPHVTVWDIARGEYVVDSFSVPMDDVPADQVSSNWDDAAIEQVTVDPIASGLLVLGVYETLSKSEVDALVVSDSLAAWATTGTPVFLHRYDAEPIEDLLGSGLDQATLADVTFDTSGPGSWVDDFEPGEPPTGVSALSALTGGGGPVTVAAKRAFATSSLSGGGSLAAAAVKRASPFSALTGGGDSTTAVQALRWQDIPGAVVASYLLSGTDTGARVRCVVSTGGASAASNEVGPIAPAEVGGASALTGGGGPLAAARKQFTAASSLSGGGSLTSFGAAESSWENISGATAAAYLLASGDESALIRCVVSSGATAAVSNTVGPVEAAAAVEATSSLSGGGAAFAIGRKETTATSHASQGAPPFLPADVTGSLLWGGGSVATQGSRGAVGGSSALTGGGQVPATAHKRVSAASVLTGGGQPVTAVAHTRAATSTLSGGGAVPAAVARAAQATSALSGGGSPTTAVQLSGQASSSLTGGGEVPSAAHKRTGVGSSLAGGGEVSLTAARRADAGSALTGGGGLSTAGEPVGSRTSAVTGGGDVTAAVSRSVAVASALSGGGQPATTSAASGSTASALSGGGETPTSHTKWVSAASALSGGGDTPITAIRVFPTASGLTGGGEPTGGWVREARTASTVSGGGRTATEAQAAGTATSVLTTGGELLAAGSKQAFAVTALSGGGESSSVSGQLHSNASALAGGGSIVTVEGPPTRGGASGLTGGGMSGSTGTKAAYAYSGLSGGGRTAAKARKPFLWRPLPGGSVRGGGLTGRAV